MKTIHDAFQTINSDGQFDARKARQAMEEWCRDNSVVNKSMSLARHLGLSGEDTYLLVSLHLLSAHEGLLATVMEDISLRVPTFYVQPHQSGPFVTDKPWGKDRTL